MRTESLQERLLNRRLIIDRGYTTPCWEYTGCRDKKTKYGVISLGRNVPTWLVHRLAASLWLDNYSPNLMVLHKCNNKPCFNYEHLYMGDRSDNTNDSVKAGNHNNSSKTHCKRGHIFDIKNTRLYKGRRVCRECEKNK